MKKRRKALGLMLVLVMLLSMMPVTATAETFSDINHHWAKDTIYEWVNSGFVSGYKDGTFKPENNITRAEFMVLVNNAFNFTEEDNTSYVDVPAGSWYRQAVAMAKKAGYIGGYPDGTVKPNNPISREEAAVMIAKLKDLEEDIQQVEQFVDAGNIAHWSKGFVGAIVKSKIMGGYPDGTFKARKYIKRAEAIVALNNALSYENDNIIKYDKAGVYGPEDGKETIQKNVVITAHNVTLQNMVIEGNLLIAESVGDGDVTLKNVTVEGDTDIQGGGENSIHVIDSTLKNVKIFKKDGKIRIVLSGKSKVDNVQASSGAKLEEKDLEDEGFQEIVIDAEETDSIVLVGSFDKLDIKAEGVKIELPKNTVVKELKIDERAEITGKGIVEKAKINADGTKLEMAPTKEMTIKKDIEVKVDGKTEKGDGKTEDMEEESKLSSGGGGGGGSSNNDSDDNETEVDVTTITVTPKTMNLTVGGAAKTIIATVLPSSATNKNVTWSSSNDGVVTVANGKVTPMAAGTARITATTEDGGFKASCTVTVREEVVEADKSNLVSAISTAEDKIKNATVGTEEGEYPQSAVDALEQAIADAQAIVDDKEATQGGVDEGVAGLNAAILTFEAAVITAPDIYKLTIMSNPDEGGTVIKEVYDKDTGEEIETEEVEFKEGDKITLRAMASEGYEFARWMKIDREISQDNPYTFYMPGSNLSLIAEFDSLIVPVRGVSVSPATMNLAVGEKGTIILSIEPDNATNQNVNWSSSDTNIATVNNGEVTAISAGTATITATSIEDSSKKASCEVTVEDKLIQKEVELEIIAADRQEIWASVWEGDSLTGNLIYGLTETNFSLVDAFENVVAFKFNDPEIRDPSIPDHEYLLSPVDGEFTGDYTLIFTKSGYQSASKEINIGVEEPQIKEIIFPSEEYTVGEVYTIPVTVTTVRMAEGSEVTVALVGPSVDDIIVAPVAGTISNNTATIQITVPATISAGMYYFQAKGAEVEPNYVTVNFVEATSAPDKEITSVASMEDITVDYGTAIESVGLPSQIEVTLDDSSTTNLAINWNTDGYNGNIAGTYPLEGILTLEDGIANTGNYTAGVNVIVNEAPDKEIVSVASIGDITVDYGTAIESVGLPSQIEVSLDDSSTTNLAVNWDKEGYDGNIAGTYPLEGTLTLEDGIANPGSYTANVNVIVDPAPDEEISGYESIADVAAGTAGSAIYADASEVITYLSTNITEVTISGTTDTVAVSSWTDTDTYDAAVAGSYTFTAIVGTLPEGYVDDVETVSEVSVEVLVEAAPDKGIASVASIEDITVDYGTAIESVGLPSQIEVTLDDSSTTNLAVNWDKEGYDGNTAGTYPLEGILTLEDGIVNTGNYTANVNVVVKANIVPVATDDSASVDEDSTVLIAVLSNDTDADNDTLTITGFTQGTDGVVSQEGDSIRYTPDADFNGSDSFTYDISDGKGGTASATVNITVNAVNDMPVASDDTGVVNENSTILIDVLTNDTDADNDTLTITGFTQGTDGVVSQEGDSIRYTPDADFNGSDSFTYDIRDGQGGTASATVNITVNAVNDMPVASDDTGVVDENSTILIEVLTNDTDADNDTLTITGFTQGTDGVVSQEGDSLRYTPDADFNGSDSFTYDISDGKGGTASATVNITVNAVNDMPVAFDDTGVVDENSTILIEVLTNDTDADNDTLTITGFTQGTDGVVSQEGDSIRYTPDADFNGSDSFTYDISDGQGGADTGEVTVTVNPVNDSPKVITGQETQEGTATPAANSGDPTAIEYTADMSTWFEDMDNDSLTYILVSAADESLNDISGDISISGADISYIPSAAQANKNVSILVKANDGTADSTGNVDISITVGAQPEDALKEITGYTPLTAIDLNIDEYLVDLEALKASGKLPTQLEVTDGTASVTTDITDWTGTFDGSTTGTATLTAVWDIPEGYIDNIDAITVELSVNVNIIQTVDTTESDNVAILAAKNVLDAAATLSPMEEVDTNVVDMAQALVNAEPMAAGVMITVSDASGNDNIGADGGITYTFSEITGNVVFALNKGMGTEAISTMAVVVPAVYTLTLEANPAEGGTATDNTNAGSYTTGSMINVTAMPAEGYEFVNWTVDGVEVSTNSNFDYTMPAGNTTLKANFQEIVPGAEITLDNILQMGVNETATASTTEAGAGDWESDMPGIASIDANTGMITAHGEGIATISYTSSDSGRVNCFDLEVYPSSEDISHSLMFGDGTTSISSGIKQLTGFPDAVNPDETRIFAITDGTTNIITVDNNGVVSYGGEYGTKTIRYELKETATGMVIEWGEVTITAEPAPAPTVSSTYPGDGAVVSKDITTSTIVFSENVTAVDLSGVKIICSFNGTPTPVANVVATIDGGDPRTIIISHDPLPYNSNLYTVTIPAGSVQNAEGTVNEEVVWSFRTGPIETPRSVTFSNTDPGATITVTELYDEMGNDSLADFIDDNGTAFDIKFLNQGEGSYSVNIQKDAGSGDIVITNPSVIEQASDYDYDLGIYRVSDEYSWMISLIVTTDPLIELSSTTYSRSAGNASFSVQTLVDHLGEDVQYDLVKDNGTAFSYELTDGTSYVTVTNSDASSTLNIADPSQAADIGTYTLTVTRNSDGIQWTAPITVTE